MREDMKRIFMVFLILSVYGCSYGRQAKRNNDLMLTLNVGQTKEEVLKVMGSPSKNEKVYTKGKDTDVWYYKTSTFMANSWDPEDCLTPMVFENGKLLGWGKDFYEHKIEFQSQIDNYSSSSQ
jgi:outer membrane protein assembly factor BamE (lipoprotein component of BamABCDE complex)